MGKYGSGSMLALPFEKEVAANIIDQSNCEIATVNQLKQTVVGALIGYSKIRRDAEI